MKVNVPQIGNGQAAAGGHLASVLAGGESASFASWLDLDGSELSAGHQVDASRGKQSNRPKEKESNEGQSSPLTGAKLSTSSNPISGASVASWNLEFNDFDTPGDGGEASSSRSLSNDTSETSDAPTITARTSSANVRTSEALAPARQQVFNESPAGMSPFHELISRELVGPSEGAIESNQDVAPKQAPAQMRKASALAASSSMATAAVQLPTGVVDNGAPALISQDGTDSELAGMIAAQKYSTTSNRQMKFDAGGQDATIHAGSELNDLSMENGKGRNRSFAFTQGVNDSASGSPASDSSRGNSGDNHRGSSNAREAGVISHAPALQTAESSAVGGFSLESSTHGHSMLVNANHPEPVRESTPNAQPKELTLPRPADTSAQLLGSALRGDLRVGVHTEVFGRVTIQTTAQGGQLSAQLSLENAKDGATLAAHLPAVEQKIVQQHGLTASVRLAGGSDGGASAGSMGRDQSGSSRRHQEQQYNGVAVQRAQIHHGTSNEGRGGESALLGGRHLGSSRLDVTV